MRQRWADFCQIFAHYNYEGFSRFQFYVITLSSGRTISQNINSDESHFWKKRHFRAIANGGRISLRFSPTAITRSFRVSNFTLLRYLFWKNYFPKRHFRRVPFLKKKHPFAQAPTMGDFCQIFAHYNYEDFPLSNFTILRHFPKSIFQNHHFRWAPFLRFCHF